MDCPNLNIDKVVKNGYYKKKREDAIVSVTFIHEGKKVVFIE